jgi:chromosome segregation ATPase
MSTTNNITDFDTSDKMNKIRHDVFTLHREMYREIDKLKEKNRVLQEDNEELNEQLNDRVMIEDIAHAACRDEEGNDFDWESEIGGLVIDNKKLREEIERDSGCEENAKLRKENEKLKEKNENLKTSIQTTTSYWTDSNELLKDEIKKLKEQIERDSGCEENAKLRKENEELKVKADGENTAKMINKLNDEFKVVQEEKDKLKKENKKLKKEVKETEEVLENYCKIVDIFPDEMMEDAMTEAGLTRDFTGNIVEGCRICKEQQRDQINPSDFDDKCEFCHDNYDEENDAWTDNI